MGIALFIPKEVRKRMERTPIKRVPIKIRKAIQKEYCECYNAAVMTADGIPQLIIGDNLSHDDLDKYLSEVKVSTPMYFSHPFTMNYVRCLEKGLPITVRTNRVLGNDILNLMSDVPHCAIHVCINSLNSEFNNDSIDNLWNMMHVAKGKKIHLVLETEYMPHLVHKLDLYELVSMTKNLVNHMLLSFPIITDRDYHMNIDRWEEITPDAHELFRSIYVPNVPTRSWEVKAKYQQEIVSGLQDFIKAKRISLELLHIEGEDGRIRHTSLHEGLPLGIRPFMYTNVDGMFVKTQVEEEEPCITCGKTIFL